MTKNEKGNEKYREFLSFNLELKDNCEYFVIEYPLTIPQNDAN